MKKYYEKSYSKMDRISVTQRNNSAIRLVRRWIGRRWVCVQLSRCIEKKKQQRTIDRNSIAIICNWYCSYVFVLLFTLVYVIEFQHLRFAWVIYNSPSSPLRCLCGVRSFFMWIYVDLCVCFYLFSNIKIVSMIYKSHTMCAD